MKIISTGKFCNINKACIKHEGITLYGKILRKQIKPALLLKKKVRSLNNKFQSILFLFKNKHIFFKFLIFKIL